MLDGPARRLLAAPLAGVGRRLAGWGVTANQLTAVGFALGVSSAVAAAAAWWTTALGLWLASRLADGLDGAVAREVGVTDLGGYLDIVADFVVYGAFVVGVAIALPDARLALAVLLLTYYINGTTLLAFSSLAERRRLTTGDDRSVRFTGGLAEGTETIIVHSLFVLLPALAGPIAWAFAAVVAVTAAWRVGLAIRALRPA